MGIETLHGIVLGIIVGRLYILGDLTVSMFKRRAGVKTTGLWILKQGGMLDVIGGFLFVVVGCYYYAASIM